MKKIVISIFFVLVALTAFAGVVTPSDAEMYASAFFAGPKTKGAPTRVQRVFPKYTPSVKSITSNDLFYIFNNLAGEGYVIISGEDAARPVIGYSLDSHFSEDVLPEHIASWFRCVEEQIQFLRRNNIKSTSEGAAEWNSMLLTKSVGGNHTPITLLETAKWDQGTPFNDKCPTYTSSDGSTKHCVTGCVQTAIAIMMKYNSKHHNWPTSNKNVFPIKTIENTYTVLGATKSGKVTAKSRQYKWDSMLDDYSSSYTTENVNQVAQLMFDLGVMQGATYKDGSTGAQSGSISKHLIDYFQYDKGAKCYIRDYYSKKQWGNMLRKELDDGYPIVYSGSSASGSAHCFIVDGYARSDFFHINWGWGGSYDGFFALDIFQSDGQGTGGNNGEAYSYSQDAQLGLKPDIQGTSSEPEPYYAVGMENIVFPIDPEFVLNKEYDTDITITGVRNAGTIPVDNTELVYMYLDLYKFGSSSSSIQLDYFIYRLTLGVGSTSYYTLKPNVSFALTDEIHLGDFIKLTARIYKDGQPRTPESDKFPVSYNPDASRGGIPLIDASFIEAKTSYASGDTFEREIFYGRKMPSEVHWFYDEKEVFDDFTVSSGKHTVKAVLSYPNLGATETIVREIIVE